MIRNLDFCEIETRIRLGMVFEFYTGSCLASSTLITDVIRNSRNDNSSSRMFLRFFSLRQRKSREQLRDGVFQSLDTSYIPNGGMLVY